MICIGILGRNNNIRKKYSELLFNKEKVLCSYKLVTDIVYFTDRRIIYFDRKFLTKTIKRTIIPYKNIDKYTVVTGSFWSKKDSIILDLGNKNFELPVAEKISTREIDKLLGKFICQS